MSAKARITSDFATQDDVAARLRISPSRTAELRRQLFDLHVTQPDGKLILVEVKNTARGSRRKQGVAGRAKKK
jgi:hypothetical protein